VGGHLCPVAGGVGAGGGLPGGLLRADGGEDCGQPRVALRGGADAREAGPPAAVGPGGGGQAKLEGEVGGAVAGGQW
jgi:hypothetical protein